MEFDTEKAAKSYALRALAKHASEAQLLRNIDDYIRYQKLNSDDLEQYQYWKEREAASRDYLYSEDFKNGNYHLGVDELILEFIEVRSIIYSFQVVDIASNPFESYNLHSQWLSGCIYKLIAIYGKLLSRHKDDQSLKNVWCSVSGYIQSSSLTTSEEVSELTKFILGINNQTSNVMKYRNKAIAHNEQQPNVEWSDVDHDLRGLCRVWSLITMWCSLGVISPFVESEKAFSGFEHVVTHNELTALKKARSKYLEGVQRWCRENFVTRTQESKRSPFAEVSIQIRA
ncbi:hypothetical protein ACLIOB_003383 [Vibrio cholerae]|uniref:hypothetical protein n=1 Tax=Vibrio cholerae TaxID=666 RepID=UPI0011EFFC78|nr:hypothetical protein [Vibrio cholerae]EJL6378770.1 hypothetical protein [Vibrio cholerae]ELI3479297.1 hypothetical protein [Vibrio cholerae]TYW33979.1 hypothetical protein FY552_18155 [Vibrio cholerae]